MLMMTLHSVLSVILSVFIFFVLNIVGNKSMYSRNKNTPFECGFDGKDSSRLPFSTRFYLLVMVFLIFDVEIALLFPIILGLKLYLLKISFFAGVIFLLVLMLGLFHEWIQGSLSWVK